MGLKVLHLMDSGGLYGAEKMLLSLVKEQMRQGLEPMILSAGEEGIDEKPVEAEAKRLGLPVTPWRMKPGFNLTAMRKILAWARHAGYELFHSHGYKFNVLLGSMPKKAVGAPTVATLHGYVHAKRFSKMWAYELVDRWSLRRLDAVVLVSEAMREEIRAKIGNKTSVIPNGLDVEAVQKESLLPLSPEIQSFRDSHEPLIIAVGRLSREKGFDRLLDAFHLFKQRYPRAGLLLLGEGKQRESLSRQIEKHHLDGAVHMPGYSRTATRCIGAADILAMPSLTEGLPITLLETMATGTTIVASSVGSIPDTLGHGEGGFLLDTLKPESLDKALDQAWRHEMGKRTRSEWSLARVKAQFSVKSMEERYRAVYRGVAAECR